MEKEQLENEIIKKFQLIGLKLLQAHTLNDDFPNNQFDLSFEVQVDDFLKNAEIEDSDIRYETFKRFQKYSEMESSSRGEKKVVVEISKYLEDGSKVGAYVLNNQLSLQVNGKLEELEKLFNIYGYTTEMDKINFVRTFSEDEANFLLSDVFKLSRQQVMIDRNLFEVEIEQQVMKLLKEFKEGVI